MDASGKLKGWVKGAIRGALEAPGVKAIRRRAWEAEFARGHPGGFLGVHATFDEARAAAPRTKGIGYDDLESAAMYRERMERIYPADYPVVYWLSRCLPGASRLVDFGGHVGIAFYAYRPYLDLGEGLDWCVCDVPAVCDAGEALARDRGARGLRFARNLAAEADDADVLLAAGSLQYLDPGFLQATLRMLDRRPRHLVVNKLPVHPTRSYVTVQDTGPAYHPYAVFRRDDLLASVEGLGYQLVDAWENAELECRVPFHRELDVPAYSGFYFRLAS